MMNAWDRVESLTDFWLRRDPYSSDLLSYKAQSLINLYGDIDGAWSLLDRSSVEGRGRAAGTQIQLALIREDWDRAIELTQAPGDIGLPLEIFGFTRERRLARIHALKGELETARTYFIDHIETMKSRDTIGRLAKGFQAISLAESYAWLGEYDRALDLADQAIELVPISADHVFGVNIDRRRTWVLAKSGDRDQALERIAAKLDQPEGWTRWNLHLDPNWDFFRDDPRFNDLVRPEGVEPEPFRQLGDGT
jgi:tetratricopeptide (TPR) repeat protein